MKNKMVLKIGTDILANAPYTLLANAEQEMDFEFEAGEHIFSKNLYPVTNGFGNKTVVMEIKIPYKYFPDDKSIFLCGSGYSGVKHNSVVLKNLEDDKIIAECKNNKYGDNNKEVVDFCEIETFNTVRNMLNDISDRLVKMAEEKGLNVYVRKDLFDSPEEGAEFNDIGFLYKDGVFKGFYDPETECTEEEYERIPITSFYGGLVAIPQGTQFWNVIGSTGDPHHGFQSWIQLWKREVGVQNPGCTAFIPGFCHGKIVGGHIVTSLAHQEAKPGMSGIVMILPICSVHNAKPRIPMTAQQPTTAVWLDNYKH